MTRRTLRPLFVFGLLVGLVRPTFADDAAPQVECVELSEENWEEFVPGGKEVDAIYGDMVLRNEHLVAVIAQPVATRHANMTVRDVAGCLIDLASRHDQSDQLSAFYPGAKAFPYRSWDKREASGSGRTASVVVTANGNEARPKVSTEYRLTAGSPLLAVVTTYTNESEKPQQISLEDSLRADGGKEDMVKTANGVHEMYTFDDRYWQQAYGLTADRKIRSNNADSRESTFNYVDDGQNSRVELRPGESFTLTRHWAAGRTMWHVHEALAEEDDQFVPTHLTVVDAAGRPIKDARLEIRSTGELLGVAQPSASGEITLPLKPTGYSVRIVVHGHTVADDVPMKVTGEESQNIILKADSYHPGTLVTKVVDEAGEGIPCKIELSPQGDVPKPDFGPETAISAVRNLLYVPHGTAEQDLKPGTYDVIISHGPEYDAIFTTTTIKAGEVTELTGTLKRTVDTTGWISSDFHSHSSPSGDNTSHQRGRVLNLVCEHIEFIPCTEHNRIDTYVPHIQALGLEKFVSTCSGMELTGKPLPLNHQNAFPLHHHPHTQDGGAPVTDVDVETQIERLALWDNRSDKLIQQNHPDIGWLFFDRDGDQSPDGGHPRAFGLMDVMEIHPITAMIDREPFVGERNNRMFNWLQLLNQGHRIPGIVNTDAHYNYHGSGWLRNWLASPTDDPADVDTMDIVHAGEHGHLVMSNGPFLEVHAQTGNSKPMTCGDDLTAADGKVNLHIKVQCPNWHDINRVFVLVNGRLHPEHDFRRETHSDRFSESVVKFDQSLDLTLDADAHLVVVACGDELKLGPVVGPSHEDQEPTAVANPIFIDTDGNGFKPNGDTIDHPLPVKAE